jgi:ribonuclease BN (tRNA processing enzyme)
MVSEIQLAFLGSGDAFGSGGRLQTCMHLRGGAADLLIDCGASSLVAMKRQSLDPSRISYVLVSHLHGDHFGGIPFLVLDGQFSRRQVPLTVVGPPGVEARLKQAMEVLFPGSSQVARQFELTFVELTERDATTIGPAEITAFRVDHACGAPPYALRVDYAGKRVAYSGDTEWTDALVEVAAGADLFVCEAYFFDKKIKYHLDYSTLRDHLPELRCRRIVLTHMSADMLERLDDIEMTQAEDGLILTL